MYLIVIILAYSPPYSTLSRTGTLTDRTLSSGIILAILLVVALLPSWDSRQNPLGMMGFRKQGILRSFVWANAFLLPIMVILSGMLLAEGPDSLLTISQVPLPSVVPGWYPLFAFAAWFVGGLAFFPLLQAFPYESMADFPKKYAIPLVATLSATIYNGTFLTGIIRWDDIVFFGLFFTIAYHETRNSIGLVFAYAMAESGVWYVVAATWGITVFESAILARTALSLVSVVALAIWHYSRGAPVLNTKRSNAG